MIRLTPKILKEVAKWLEENEDKWLRKEDATIKWFNKSAEILEKGGRISNFRNLAGAVNRILGTNHSFKQKSVTETKNQIKRIKKKLTDLKNKYGIAKLNEEDEQKRKELNHKHQLYFKRSMDFGKKY